MSRRWCRPSADSVVRRMVGWQRHAFAPVVDGGVRGQLPEPGLKRTLGVVAREVAEKLDEDLLREVMSLVEVSEVLVSKAVDAALQSADQLFKCMEVATGGLPDELPGRYRSRFRRTGHGEPVGPCLGIHQR